VELEVDPETGVVRLLNYVSVCDTGKAINPGQCIGQDEGAGMTVDGGPGGRWSEPWLPGVAVGLWVCAGPWVWGYDDVEGAIATDVLTGAAIAVVFLAGIPFPALLSLNVLAGLWLVTAPWLVGFGTAGGPVGLSDTVAGVVTCALALRGLSAATRRLRVARPGPVGRMPRRGPG
jgi:hypothetical protein